MIKQINGDIYFNEKSFNTICKELEAGEKVEIHIDCIGHLRNNLEQEIYKEELKEKYKNKLETIYNDNGHHYTYTYKLESQ